ncbi:arginine--tRNA ligase [Hyphomonas johnsonii]|uniref:Arginine--tRNA ligase n=1 Tax=Hyphomonas johnsonii MHS-2 TaxID=1280950 RepID=A0A059F9P0_9PROT|nr:arginine--tRNA ligase [Hyphomonas johnsonii]KCZ87317.1 arginyl-tRNA ligase [Hyphomonas johnsonii MHS-2]
MASLTKDLTAAASAAFSAIGLEARWGDVRRSDKPDLADFQCDGAMGAAKSAGRNPREIASEIAEVLKAYPAVLSAEVAGPGFINLRVSDAVLSARAADILADKDMAGGEPAPDPQVTVIDFGGPNVAKPMHVGHLRSAVIGDTLQRLLKFLGDTVTSDTHLGDWGLQMGHLVTELYDEQPDLIYFDESYTGPYPDEPPVTIEDLGRLYPAASNKAKDDPARNQRSQNAVAELQAGRPGYRALLKHFINVSVAALKVDYAFLNVSFDLWKGESDVDHLIPGLIERFCKAGLAEESQGALIVHVARESDKKEMPPVMLLNSRGGTGYHTTDLATIEDRMMHMHPTAERMLYVVDQRQALHFEQVFRAAELVGLIDEGHLEHIGFGTVNGPDGKPFKTREGGVLRLADLILITTEAVKEKLFREDASTGEFIVHDGLTRAIQEHFSLNRKLGRRSLAKLYVNLMMTFRSMRMKDEWNVRKTSTSFNNIIRKSTLKSEANAMHYFYGLAIDKTKSQLIDTIVGHLLKFNFRALGVFDSSRSSSIILRRLQEYIEELYARPIAVAALRFADLQNTRTTNYVFDIERFTSFEGKTGPYLLYAAVRIKSLLRRAEADGNAPGEIVVGHDAERALVLALDGFGAALLGAREKRMPHILCEHVFGLSQAFSGFYGALPIANESDPALRASRLALATAVLRQLEVGLGILGIDVPERM